MLGTTTAPYTGRLFKQIISTHIYEAEKGAAKTDKLPHRKQIQKRNIVEQWFGFSPNRDFSHPIQLRMHLGQLGAGHIVVDALTNETDSSH